MKIIDYIKGSLAGIITAIGYFVGGFDKMIVALLIMMVIDYVTGIIKAIVTKKLSSEIGFKGIFKKVVTVMLVGLATILDNELGFDGARYITIAFFIANEGLSILENSSEIGVPIPNKLKEVLSQLRAKDEVKDGE